jgi:MOSC domain-containing protein YiiM
MVPSAGGLCKGTEEAVCIGDAFGMGEARVQVSQPRQPCWKLSRRWRIEDLAGQVQSTARTGWYFRVLVEGSVAE